MSTAEAIFIRELKKQIIIFLIGAVLSVTGVAIAFYYNTTNNIENIREKYEYIETRQTYLHDQIYITNERKIDKVDVIREFDEIKRLLRDTNMKIDKL